ncbi:hypothetical protein OKW26_001586 [Paraburkholderia sp. 32]
MSEATGEFESSLRVPTDEHITRETIADLLRLLGKTESKKAH